MPKASSKSRSDESLRNAFVGESPDKPVNQPATPRAYTSMSVSELATRMTEKDDELIEKVYAAYSRDLL